MLLGTHIRMRYGYKRAAQMANEMGSSALQLFPKNPRALSVKPITTEVEQDALAFKRLSLENGLVSIMHSPYPTQLAYRDEQHKQDNILSLLNDLELAELCGCKGVVVHFGQLKGADPLEGYKRMLEILNIVLDKWQGEAKLLIENNAGQKGKMGTTMEECIKIRELASHPEKIGFCFDTCHAFASGIWGKESMDKMLELGTSLGYWELVEAVHLNSSMYEHSSFIDRHARIGEGYVPVSDLRQFVHYLKHNPPFIMEVSIPEGMVWQEEIKRVHQLLH